MISLTACVSSSPEEEAQFASCTAGLAQSKEVHLLPSWYLVLGTWYLVLGTWYLVLSTWYLVLGLAQSYCCLTYGRGMEKMCMTGIQTRRWVAMNGEYQSGLAHPSLFWFPFIWSYWMEVWSPCRCIKRNSWDTGQIVWGSRVDLESWWVGRS